jgi:insertion element IS1 protein InsB
LLRCYSQAFVGNKSNPRGLGHAIDHHTGQVLAYVFGRRQDEVFLQLKALLEPFGLTRYDTDHWGAYTRRLDPDVHSPGKRNTQKIERPHLTLRTRIQCLVRKTICFSTSTQMHDIVIGLFVNRYAFGRAVSPWPSPLLKHYPHNFPRHMRTSQGAT